MQAMDSFVLPSIFEGLGIVLIEAQALGLNCFCSDVIPEEAKVTENYFPLSLKFNPKVWAEEIVLKSKSNLRKNKVEDVREAGFDIKLEANKLEAFYVGLYQQNLSIK
jgi:hypothetical protein